VKFVV